MFQSEWREFQRIELQFNWIILDASDEGNYLQNKSTATNCCLSRRQTVNSTDALSMSRDYWIKNIVCRPTMLLTIPQAQQINRQSIEAYSHWSKINQPCSICPVVIKQFADLYLSFAFLFHSSPDVFLGTTRVANEDRNRRQWEEYS